MRPEGLSQREITMTPSGIEPTTFRLVAECHYLPRIFVSMSNKMSGGHPDRLKLLLLLLKTLLQDYINKLQVNLTPTAGP